MYVFPFVIYRECHKHFIWVWLMYKNINLFHSIASSWSDIYPGLQYWHDWIASLACCEIGRLLRNDLVCGILNTFFPMLDTAFYLWRASCHRRYNNYWFLFLCLHVQNSFVYQHCESESEIIIIISLSPRGFPRLIYNSLWRTLARLLFRSLQFILEGERCPRPD